MTSTKIALCTILLFASVGAQCLYDDLSSFPPRRPDDFISFCDVHTKEICFVNGTSNLALFSFPNLYSSYNLRVNPSTRNSTFIVSFLTEKGKEQAFIIDFAKPSEPYPYDSVFFPDYRQSWKNISFNMVIDCISSDVEQFNLTVEINGIGECRNNAVNPSQPTPLGLGSHILNTCNSRPGYYFISDDRYDSLVVNITVLSNVSGTIEVDPLASTRIPNPFNRTRIGTLWKIDGTEGVKVNTSTAGCGQLLYIIQVYPFAVPFQICNRATPYKCPDGTCANNITECAEVACPHETPYRCAFKQCVAAPGLCAAEILCGEEQLKCWDGSCVTDTSDCPALPCCPMGYPRRCWDGCKRLNETCTPLNCTSVTCTDGSCADETALCPEFNGCPVGTIHCPDGTCALEISECMCPNGLSRCFDGTCQEDDMKCGMAPYQLKPAPVAQTFRSTESTRVFVPSDEHITSPLCFVTIPQGALDIPATLGAALRVRPVADSMIQKVKNRQGNTNSSAVLSPILNLSFFTQLGKVPQPFKKNITITCVGYIPFNTKEDSLCLAYINAEKQWECVDAKLVKGEINTEHMATLYFLSGTTNHFSSFAVLLGDSSSNPSDTSEESFTDKKSNEGVSSGLIIGVVIAAVVVVIGGFVAGYFIHKKKRSEEDSVLQNHELQVTSEDS